MKLEDFINGKRKSINLYDVFMKFLNKAEYSLYKKKIRISAWKKTLHANKNKVKEKEQNYSLGAEITVLYVFRNKRWKPQKH